MKLQGFVGGSYQMDSLQFDAQRSINLYALASESGTSKEPSALRSIPGYIDFASVGGGPIRSAKTTANGRAWVVSGYDLYEIFADGTSTNRGTLLTGVVNVSMAENGTELMMVDGTAGYIYDMDADTFNQILDVDFPQCNSVVFQDGYFIVPKVGTAQFYISGLYDGTSWDSLDFSSVDSNPDNLVGLVADAGNLWLFGEVSTEVWQNTGALDFPYARIPGAVTQTGCAAWGTIQQIDNTIAWLGVDAQGRGVVWKANGYTAQRISTQAIESRISSADNFTDSYAYVYHEQGHVFYILKINGLDADLVFDFATGLWHERQYRNTVTGLDEQHKGSCHLFFAQKNLIGDRELGKVYEQKLAYFDYAGEEIIRTRITPHIQEEKVNLTFSSVELDMQVGVGLQSGQGSDPKCMMQYSDDGGETWSYELFAPVGRAGKYKKRVRWSRCGSARDRVWKFSYSEPTFCQMNGCYINAT